MAQLQSYQHDFRIACSGLKTLLLNQLWKHRAIVTAISVDNKITASAFFHTEVALICLSIGTTLSKALRVCFENCANRKYLKNEEAVISIGKQKWRHHMKITLTTSLEMFRPCVTHSLTIFRAVFKTSV